MNPTDAMPKDYGMYYNNCWMRHTRYGVGMIQVVDGGLFLNYIKGKDPFKVKASNLSCWWPRPGAFNCGNHAIFIARRAIRNMRKSATGQDHYFVKWGTPYGKDIMMVLRSGDNSKSLAEAASLMASGASSSVAITRDIIIHPEEEINQPLYTVLFRGIEVGRLVSGSFEPLFSGSPLTGRVIRQLEGAK